MYFNEKTLVYPSFHTMREGVLYFQYVCGHDDLIRHKKGHSASKVKYIWILDEVCIRIASRMQYVPVFRYPIMISIPSGVLGDNRVT